MNNDKMREAAKLARKALKESLPYMRTNAEGGGPDCTNVFQAILDLDSALARLPENEPVEFSNEDAERVVRAFWRRIHPYIYELSEPPYPKEFGEKVPVEFQAHMETALSSISDAHRPALNAVQEIKIREIIEHLEDHPNDRKWVRYALKSLLAPSVAEKTDHPEQPLAMVADTQKPFKDCELECGAYGGSYCPCRAEAAQSKRPQPPEKQ